MTPEAETARALRRLAKTLTKLGHSGPATCERAAGLLEALEEAEEWAWHTAFCASAHPVMWSENAFDCDCGYAKARARLERARAGGL